MDGQEATSRWADKLELCYRQYERSMDIEIALTIVPLTAEEKDRMRADPDFVARVAVYDAKKKEELMEDVRLLSKTAKSEGVRLNALKELGKAIYPERFRDTFEGSLNVRSSVLIVDDIPAKEKP